MRGRGQVERRLQRTRWGRLEDHSGGMPRVSSREEGLLFYRRFRSRLALS